MPSLSEKRENPLFVDSIERAFGVLNCFLANGHELTNKQIQTETGLTFQTVDRAIKTLESHGYIEKNERKKTYQLALRALDFQYKFLITDPLVKMIWPLLVDIRDKTKGRVSYCELDGTEIVYLARIAGDETDFLTSLVGRRRPAFATAGGRVILSGLAPKDRDGVLMASSFDPITPKTETDPRAVIESIEAIANDGYAMTAEETILGEVSYAAPVLGNDDNVRGAIVVSIRDDEAGKGISQSELIALLLAVARSVST
ncbi:IclR family transcriptional regulator [Primorskyibacter aestuariivivens]|uniref:IclR family transcriptional regulator n=1 Tax=Primorskyibacter aestuariivivens TaxID=1888912 RepID=UPI002301560F|nr:IclR family transcriptional regulator [Primorskyibacter aestuariivivens]MDA7430904.1 IclR family transcriptional regulator [Primorskyibacter aestuariivivens]